MAFGADTVNGQAIEFVALWRRYRHLLRKGGAVEPFVAKLNRCGTG